jgi:hypothetical protein
VRDGELATTSPAKYNQAGAAPLYGVMNLLLIITLLLVPITGTGQPGHVDQEIELLQLDLIAYATSFSHAIIIIESDGSGMQLAITTYDFKDEVIRSERHAIPSLPYKEFKAAVVPLEIKSMKGLSNLYLVDSMTAEITFRDSHGNFNRFETRVPAVRGRNLYLIETIIELAKALPISDEHRAYLESLYDNYLIYCRKN